MCEAQSLRIAYSYYGAWGHTPSKFLKIRCIEIRFGSNFDYNVALQSKATYTSYDLHYDLAAHYTHHTPDSFIASYMHFIIAIPIFKSSLNVP